MAAASPPLVSIRAPLPTHGPKIKAPAAIVIDADTGAVLYAKRPNMRRPIASTTKIMTAIVAMSRLRPSDIVVVPARGDAGAADYAKG